MALNPAQFKIAIGSIGLFVLMGLYPPWTYTVDVQSMHREKPAGYALIIDPPAPEINAPAYGVRLDLSRLLMQWLVLAGAAGGGLLFTRNSGGGTE